jgi:hypothetical protein
MKKFVFSLIIIIAFITPNNKAQAMDPKGKAFMIICTYGTVGGALLGFASMAFGSNSRAIAQGASLGLYAGIGFGAYVISSHRRSLNPEEEAEDPYNDAGPPPGYGAPQGYGDDGGQGYGAPAPEESPGGFFGSGQRSLEMKEDILFNYKLKNKKGRDFSLPVYINLINMQF